MVSHPETGSDSPIESDRESGHDNEFVGIGIMHSICTGTPYNIRIECMT